MSKEDWRRRKLLWELIRTCQYVITSFSQVPATETVPPIVLHDCKDRLETAWKAAKEAMEKEYDELFRDSRTSMDIVREERLLKGSQHDGDHDKPG